MDEINALREELAKIRERVAVLEAKEPEYVPPPTFWPPTMTQPMFGPQHPYQWPKPFDVWCDASKPKNLVNQD